jgi:tripeptide aminopeptidase
MPTTIARSHWYSSCRRKSAYVFVGGIGAADWKVTVRGVPAHAAVHPEDGVSAVAVTALALAALHRDGWHGRIEMDDHTGTANVGAIRGGNASNVVTDVVEISGEARSHDDAFLETILEAIEAAFRVACTEVANSAGERAAMDFHAARRYSAFRIPEDCQVATTVGKALASPPVYEVSDGGVDANNLNVRHCIPTVTVGAGAHRLHTVNEFCDIDEFIRACDLLLRLATSA